MAAQFIDLAREIPHSPFPKRLRSVTWPSDPLLSKQPCTRPEQHHRESAADWRLKFRGGSVADTFRHHTSTVFTQWVWLCDRKALK